MIVDFCIECIETYDSLIESVHRKNMIAARRSNLPRLKGKLSKSSAFVLPPKPTNEFLSRNPEGNPWIREKLTDDSMTSTDSSFTSLTESSVEVVFVPGTNRPVNEENDEAKISYNPSPLYRKAASRIKQHRSGMNGFDEDISTAPSLESTKSIKSQQSPDSSQDNVSYPKLPHAVKKYMSKCGKTASIIDNKCATQHLSDKSSTTPKKSLLHLAQKKTSKQAENKAKKTIVANEHHQTTATIAQSGVSQSLLERKAMQAMKLAKSRKSVLDNRTKKVFNSSSEEESHCPKGSDDNGTSSEGIEVSLSSGFPSEKGIEQKKSASISEINEFPIALTTDSAVIMKENWSDDEFKLAARRREVLLRAQSLLKD
mmetsp:Transcript_5549/g.11965  ORF Transcript_5549/g.11965 Transcript_5549/m.11965 type:complete len:371 (+) Transcript_5549:167-1279(+)